MPNRHGITRPVSESHDFNTNRLYRRFFNERHNTIPGTRGANMTPGGQHGTTYERGRLSCPQNIGVRKMIESIVVSIVQPIVQSLVAGVAELPVNVLYDTDGTPLQFVDGDYIETVD